MKPVIRYSEAFKLHVVKELSTGRFNTPSEASAFLRDHRPAYREDLGS